MRGITCWQHRPYRPVNQLDQLERPMIVRLAPYARGVEYEWIDLNAPDAPHRAYLRGADGAEPFQEVALEGPVSRIGQLTPFRDYELCVVRADERPSHARARLFRTIDAPGTVINYLHPKDDFYAFSGKALCSPSIVRLPSGALLASMDVYAPRAPQNLTLLFRSEDGGESWRYVADLHPCFWANLLVWRGRLYAIGCSTEFGDLMIGASDDEGATWTAPTHIFCGSSTVGEGWQQAPMPVLHAHGRLYTSVEYGRWPGVGVSVLSAAEDANLLDAASWRATPPKYVQRDWPGKPAGDLRMILEGNVVVDGNGDLIDILRVQATGCDPEYGVALVLSINPDDPEGALEFRQFLPMDIGSNSKAFIRLDEDTKTYYAIGNVCVDPDTPAQRNVLSMYVSRDAYHWALAEHLIDYRQERPGDVGFQYPSFVFDGGDILLMCRSAIGGARNFHDANFATFHRIRDFRKYAALALE